MVVDPGEAEVGEGQAAQAANGVVDGARPARHVGQQLFERGGIHVGHYPARV